MAIPWLAKDAVRVCVRGSSLNYIILYWNNSDPLVTLSMKYIIIAICRKIHHKFQRSNAHSRIPLLAHVNERPEITRDISHTFARDTGKIAGISGSRNIFSSRTNRLHVHVRARAWAQLITRQTLAATIARNFSTESHFS